MNTSTNQSALAPGHNNRLAAIGWWVGFILLACVLALAEVAIVSCLFPKISLIGSAHMNSVPKINPTVAMQALVMMSLLLACAIIPIGPVTVFLASMLSKRHRGRLAIILATTGGLVWSAFTIVILSLFSPWNTDNTLMCFAAWLMPGSAIINVIGQVLVAYFINKKAH